MLTIDVLPRRIPIVGRGWLTIIFGSELTDLANSEVLVPLSWNYYAFHSILFDYS